MYTSATIVDLQSMLYGKIYCTILCP